MGRSTDSLHTWIHWSVEQEAKDVLVCQSTSKAGAEWKLNCWVHWPLAASQIIVVLSTWKTGLMTFENWKVPITQYPSRQDVISFFVPFQSKNRSFVLSQSAGQHAVSIPNPGVSIVATCRQQTAIALQTHRNYTEKHQNHQFNTDIPVQWGHVLVARDFAVTFTDTVT